MNKELLDDEELSVAGIVKTIKTKYNFVWIKYFKRGY